MVSFIVTVSILKLLGSFGDIFAVTNATQQTEFIKINLHEWWLKSNSLILDAFHYKNRSSIIIA